MIIAIILSLLIVGTICTLLLFFLFSIKQKKISSQVAVMIDNIDKRKNEINNLDQKLTEAVNYLSQMQPLDLALELEEKIKKLKNENEAESLNVATTEQKQKEIQEQLQSYKSTKENSTAINKISTAQNAVSKVTEVLDSEIDLNHLAEELANFVQKTETIDNKDKEILREAEITLGKFQGHLSSLIQTYNTANKRVAGLDAQYQELQQEYQKLLAKLEEDKSSTKS